MNDYIQIVIPGTPVGWARQQLDTRKRPPRFFTSDEQKAIKAKIRIYAHAAAHAAGDAVTGDIPWTGPVGLTLFAIAALPRSRWRKGRYPPAEPNTKKPDLDNIEKLVLDALEGLVYVNDKQVCYVAKQKLIGCQGQPAGLVLQVWDWSERMRVVLPLYGHAQQLICQALDKEKGRV